MIIEMIKIELNEDEAIIGYNYKVTDGDETHEGFISSSESDFGLVKPLIQARIERIPYEVLQARKQSRINELNHYLAREALKTHHFAVGSKTIKLKANDKTKSNLQDLKGTLDDMIALGIFNADTDTFDAFYNGGETAPISITYTEVLQVRVQLAQILENLYTLTKTIPAQLNAINLDDYESLEAAIAAVEAISYE